MALFPPLSVPSTDAQQQTGEDGVPSCACPYERPASAASVGCALTSLCHKQRAVCRAGRQAIGDDEHRHVEHVLAKRFCNRFVGVPSRGKVQNRPLPGGKSEERRPRSPDRPFGRTRKRFADFGAPARRYVLAGSSFR